MNLGFDKQQLQRVHRCYCNAKEQRLYEPGESLGHLAIQVPQPPLDTAPA
jgi:hypothetical protein